MAGKYDGIAGGLVAGFGVGALAKRRHVANKQEQTNTFAREQYFNAGNDGQKEDILERFMANDPKAAGSFMKLLDGQSQVQNDTLRLQTEQVGALSAWAIEDNDSEIAMQRLAQIKEAYIDTGKMSKEVASRFPAVDDPKAFSRLQMNAASSAKFDKLMDSYFNSRKNRESAEKDKGVDDHKTNNTIRKQQHKAKLDSNLEEDKHVYRSAENAQKGSDKKGKSVNERVRAISKNYREMKSTDDMGYDSPKFPEATHRKFERTLKKYLAGGMDEFEAEEKAAGEAYGGGSGTGIDNDQAGDSDGIRELLFK